MMDFHYSLSWTENSVLEPLLCQGQSGLLLPVCLSHLTHAGTDRDTETQLRGEMVGRAKCLQLWLYLTRIDAEFINA